MRQTSANNQSRGPALKPFIKWAGGKGQLLSDIRKSYPQGLGKAVTKYAEPFVGGGAVLFDILSCYDISEVYISDINAQLINAYRAVQSDAEGLITRLSALQNEYRALETEGRKAHYYRERERFNSLVIDGETDVDTERAALFIFLNKTCFNGLYRVNKRGLFNVPAGAYKNPCICDGENLRSISAALKNVTIVCADYRECADFIDKNTFVYFDPPYRPLNETAKFTSYTQALFDDNSQVELAGFVSEMDKRQAKIVISNSDPKNVDIEDDFFDSLYQKHRINRVQATRMINCNGESRGKISELLISNY